MIKTVIVPLDGSEFALRAVPVAAELASFLDAELVLMVAGWGDVPRIGGVEAVAFLKEQAEAARVPRVRTEVVRGQFAVTAITTIAEGAVAPVVCMTTHGRRGFGQAVFGSVAEETVRRLRVPVLLVGPVCESRWPNARASMLVCHDGSATASAIVPVAGRFAEALGLSIVVVEVVAEPEAGTEPGPSHAVTDCAERLRGCVSAVDVRRLEGAHPAEVIVDCAATLPASIVAMSSHGRTGLDRVTVGSVTASVVRRSPCPVLVTRPRDLLRT